MKDATESLARLACQDGIGSTSFHRILRIESCHHRRSAGLLNNDIAGKMDRDVRSRAEILGFQRGVPDTVDEVLAVGAGLGPQHPADMGFGQYRETFTPHREPRPDDRFVVALLNFYRVAILGHLSYGNPYEQADRRAQRLRGQR